MGFSHQASRDIIAGRWGYHKRSFGAIGSPIIASSRGVQKSTEKTCGVALRATLTDTDPTRTRRRDSQPPGRTLFVSIRPESSQCGYCSELSSPPPLTPSSLNPSLRLHRASEGDTIIQEGDADRSLFKFYIVETGQVRAYVLQDGEEVLMSHLGPGERSCRATIQLLLWPRFMRRFAPSPVNT